METKTNTSRTKNSMRNIVFSLVAYCAQIILSFVVRRYFIYYFNEEYLGLNSLFSNILSLLSLAELGFGSAIVFSMYKPMADGDEEKVRELLHLYKKYYTIIAVVVTSLGLLVLPFMGYFAKKAPNVDINLYVVYLIFLFNSVVSYFCAYRRSLLYTSQRNDIESKISILSNIFLYAVQLLIIVFVQNYYLFLLANTVSVIFNSVLVLVITQKKYANYIKKPSKPLDEETKKIISKNVYSLIFHKIGSAVVYSTDSLIIYLVLNAVTLGLYSNYLMITSAVTTLISLVANAIKGSIGNSIATQTPEQNLMLCKKINFIYMWIVSFCAICVFALANPFIETILTKSETTDLTLNFVILILISYNFFFLQAKGMVGMFKECVGLFYQDRYKSLIEALVNLVVSLVLAYLIGLPGVIIGTIVSTLTVCIWVEPYVLNKYYFKTSTTKYLLQLAFRTLVTTIVGIATYFICSLLPNGGILWLIIRFMVCAIVPNVLLLLCYFWTPEFKECIKWFKDIFRNFKVRRQTAGENGEGIVPVEFVASGLESMENTVPMSDIIVAETLAENEKNATNEMGNNNDAVGEVNNKEIIVAEQNEESVAQNADTAANINNSSEEKIQNKNDGSEEN